jgi:hypothetical protein
LIGFCPSLSKLIMRRLSPLLGLCAAAFVASSLGCTMCSNDHLCDYAGVGGKWQRSNPTCGRVGSILSDAGAYQNGSKIEFGSNYGDSWDLVEGQPTPMSEAQIIDGELIENSTPEFMPEPGSIMIGP